MFFLKVHWLIYLKGPGLLKCGGCISIVHFNDNQGKYNTKEKKETQDKKSFKFNAISRPP